MVAGTFEAALLSKLPLNVSILDFILQAPLYLYYVIRWKKRSIPGLPQQLSNKVSTCNAEDIRNVSSIPGSGRSLGEYSSILAWRIPWTEEPGGLQSIGLTESDMTKATQHARVHSITSFGLSTVSKGLVSAIYTHIQSKQHTIMLNCLLVLPRIQNVN